MPLAKLGGVAEPGGRRRHRKEPGDELDRDADQQDDAEHRGQPGATHRGLGHLAGENRRLIPAPAEPRLEVA